MDKPLDPDWVMARLRGMLDGYQRLLSDWNGEVHVMVRVTFQQEDGGRVTFAMGTEPADGDDGW